MSCPTCDHPRRVLLAFPEQGPKVYHCPRCGTQSVEYATRTETTVPALVGRCRMFERALLDAEEPDGVEAMRTVGITESINLPGDRP